MSILLLVFVGLIITAIVAQSIIRLIVRIFQIMQHQRRQLEVRRQWAAYTPSPEIVRAAEILAEAANEGRANIDELSEVFYQVASYPSTADYGYYLKLKHELIDNPADAPARWALSDDGEIIDLDSEVK